jgi:hypothetical protein
MFEDHPFKPPKTTFIKTWLMDEDKRKYQTFSFLPYSGNVSPHSETIYNTFHGFEILQHYKPNTRYITNFIETKCQILINHIKKIAKDDHNVEYMLNWMSHCLQKPNKKIGTALVIKGKQGNGKNTLYNIMKSLIGKQYCNETSNLEHVVGKFNTPRADKLLILLDEIEFKDVKENLGNIKTTITSPFFNLESKGLKIIENYNSFENIIMLSNNDFCIPKEDNDRRFFVVDVSPVDYGTAEEKKEYFDNLYKIIGNGIDEEPDHKILGYFYEYLMNRDISNYDFIKNIKTQDGDEITQLNVEKLFLDEFLYKELKGDIVIYEKKDANYFYYKTTKLFKHFNAFIETRKLKSSINAFTFSRNITKDKKGFIESYTSNGASKIKINIEQWKLYSNYKEEEEDAELDF